MTVNGSWYEWSNWTDCSRTCGGGLQTRDRICERPKYGGFDCDGPADEIRNCSTDPCPRMFRMSDLCLLSSSEYYQKIRHYFQKKSDIIFKLSTETSVTLAYIFIILLIFVFFFIEDFGKQYQINSF